MEAQTKEAAEALTAAKQAAKEELAQQLKSAADRAEIERERAVLAAQRECMEEINQLREALAQSREEKAALEIKLARIPEEKSKPK